MNMLTFYLAIILFNFVFEAQNYSFYSIPQNVFRIILDNKFVLGSVPSAKQGAVPSAKAQKKPNKSPAKSPPKSPPKPSRREGCLDT